MKSGTGNVDAGDQLIGAQLLGDFFRKLAGLLAGILGEHHRGIGCHVAVRGVARWLDRHARLIDPCRQFASGDQRSVGAVNAIKDFGENVLCRHENNVQEFAVCRALTQFRGRVKEPAVFGERVAVGHAGDEIGDAARARRCIGVRQTLLPFGRQDAEIGAVAREQAADDAGGLVHDMHDTPMAIHPRSQKRLDGTIRLRDRR